MDIIIVLVRDRMSVESLLISPPIPHIISYCSHS
jgi:hypothetical protein